MKRNPRAPKFDRGALVQLRKQFTEVYRELSKFTSTDNERVDSDTLVYQVPGGMLSNFRNQLKEQGMSDKFDLVLAEIPVVREALGWIPLVTPTSQIVGTQAMLNVKFGRWKNLSQPAIDIALSKYGKTPGPVDPSLLKMIQDKTGEKPVEGRPADALKPRMETLRSELAAAGLPTNDEACVLHAMFPREFAALHKKRASPGQVAAATVKALETSPAKPASSVSAKPRPVQRYAIVVEGRRTEVVVEYLEA